jgi:hypothetical protein
MWILLDNGVGNDANRRGTRKRDREPEPDAISPVRANATERLPSVALENHLNPSRRYADPRSEDNVGVGTAVVSVLETSDPPVL